MESKIFHKNLYERPFNAIKNGKKNVEIRANKNSISKNSVNFIKEGDVIIFKILKVEKKLDVLLREKHFTKMLENYWKLKEPNMHFQAQMILKRGLNL